MYHESIRCISILFYTNKHDNIKKNCVILENISTICHFENYIQIQKLNCFRNTLQ